MKYLNLIICGYLLISCTKSTEIQVVEELIVLDKIEDTIDFSPLDKIFIDNEILLLGEASHGDGKTFEVKSDLIKYLIDNHGYTTIAFEAKDFLEMEFINGRKGIDSLVKNVDKENWIRQWNPWGPAKQIQGLVEITTAEQLDFIGLETFDYFTTEHLMNFLNKNLEEINLNLFDEEVWDLLQEIHLKMYYSDHSTILQKEYAFYDESMNKILNAFNESKDKAEFNESDMAFSSQIVENMITYSQLLQNKSSNPTDQEINRSVEIRDQQMAKNLIWYKKRNPNAKIIVWLANFHAARNLREVLFENGDPLRYSKFTVFGEHISNAYGEKVYSMAFTSSQGASKIPYNFEGIKEQIIESEDNTLEHLLESKDIDYGYLDLSSIRKKAPEMEDEKFNSIMLGYVNQAGKWLKVFDGVFYIKKNEPAIPVEF